jgi:hypothetical protein
MTWCVGANPAFFLHGPQLQQLSQPSPHDLRHFGHSQHPLATAKSMSSPCLFLKHIPQNCTGLAASF